MDRILIETAFEVLVQARALEAQGRSIIHLEIGEPDLPHPAHIVEAGKKALDEGWTHYGPTQGYPELREVLAKHVGETRGINVGTGEVCVVPGGKPIIFFPMLALIEAGRRGHLSESGLSDLRIDDPFSGGDARADAAARRARLFLRSGYVAIEDHGPNEDVDPELAAESDRRRDSRGGYRSDRRDAAGSRRDRAVGRNLFAHLVMASRRSRSRVVPGMLEKTIILDGFSKIYAMTGWRMGYGVMPAWLVDAVNKLMVNSNSCTASFTQRAGIAALTGPQDGPEKMVAEFRRRRDAFVAGSEHDAGIPMSVAGRRVLRVPEYYGYRVVV